VAGRQAFVNVVLNLQLPKIFLGFLTGLYTVYWLVEVPHRLTAA
jgi:hypothetical protein